LAIALTNHITKSATNKAHGMDGELVEPDWQPLTMAEVRTLLREFPELGKPVNIVSTSPRPFSAAGVVRIAKQSIFIKRHHRQVRDREGLLEEHRFIAHLRAHGAPVPLVFQSAQGETAIEMGDWSYEVHEAPEGMDIYEDAPSWTPFRGAAHAHSAGCALAGLHLASQGFDALRRKPRPLVASFTIFAADDPKGEAENYLFARPALADNAGVINCTNEALRLLASFHAELRPLLPMLPPLWTHNDLHASNLLWSDSGDDARATAIIDFGLADRSCAVHDIAHAIERNIVEWLALGKDRNHPETVPIHLDHLGALLDGYESVRPLSDAEAAALAPMAALCHAEFALSEADYFLGVLHSQEKARMAYHGWLIKHARWFLGSEGARLLDALRQRSHGRQTHGVLAS
jgi:Ser/Thr protein kinase RdoA (MazF antagonist)